MSQLYQAQLMYEAEHETRVQIFSKRCRYIVHIEDEEVTLFGPGVEETATREAIYEEFDDVEDFGIFIVLLFENSLWPKEEE